MQEIYSNFSEFKLFQSFRIFVLEVDKLRFFIDQETKDGKTVTLDDAVLIDISLTGIAFKTKEKIKIGEGITASLQFRNHNQIEVTGEVVRVFYKNLDDQEMTYGVKLDYNARVRDFLKYYIGTFSIYRLKKNLIDSALRDRYKESDSQEIQMLSILFFIFNEISKIEDRDGLLKTMLNEVRRMMNAEKGAIILHNTESNMLESFCLVGYKKEESIKFDYRLGIAGRVFNRGEYLNLSMSRDRKEFEDLRERPSVLKLNSIICYGIQNREGKVIGVIEIINKMNQDSFTIADEKIMKVLAMVVSSIFHNYGQKEQLFMLDIDSRLMVFSQMEGLLVGKSRHVKNLIKTILKVRDLKHSILMEGENGMEKESLAKVIHLESVRGLNSFETIDCQQSDLSILEKAIFSDDKEVSKLHKAKRGTLFLNKINRLPFEFQEKLNLLMENQDIKCRFISSTSEVLEDLIEKGEFCKSLYEKISHFEIKIIPLRKRMEDFDFLSKHYLDIECKREKHLLKPFAPRLFKEMLDYSWPGNLKELRFFIKRAVLLNQKNAMIVDASFDSYETLPLVSKNMMFFDLPIVVDHHLTLKERLAILEREIILNEIKRCNGNKSKAALEMKISREALRKKLIFSGKVLERWDNKGSYELYKLKSFKKVS